MGFENLDSVESPVEKSENWLKEKFEKFAENHSDLVGVLETCGLWGFVLSNTMGATLLANSISGDTVSVASATAISAVGGIWGILKGMEAITDEMIEREERKFSGDIKNLIEKDN
jgi:hypothetical protein